VVHFLGFEVDLSIFKNLVVFYTGKDATVDFEDVGHSDSAIEIMEKYFVGEVDTTTLPAEAKNNTPPPVQATTLNYQIFWILFEVLAVLGAIIHIGLCICSAVLWEKKASPMNHNY
jgi:cytochrome b involved in lipid metabolism